MIQQMLDIHGWLFWRVLIACGALGCGFVTAATLLPREPQKPSVLVPVKVRTIEIVRADLKFGDRWVLPIPKEDRLGREPPPQVQGVMPKVVPVKSSGPERRARDICMGKGRRWYDHHRRWRCNRRA